MDIKGANITYWRIKAGSMQDRPFEVPTFEGAF
jgi:hypothetical protein